MKKKLLWILALAVGGSLCLFACATSRAGYESAAYHVVERVPGDIEIREYPSLTTVSTQGNGTDSDGSFMRLFRYIQGDNASRAKIAMTTPVFMERTGSDSTTMSFVLPADVAESGAPDPKANGVSLNHRPAGRHAVLRFSGVRAQVTEKAALAKLEAFLRTRSLKASGPPAYAYYDPPWTPGPLRRNEVLLPLGP